MLTAEPSPLQSLQTGTWFKLICGASYQALPAVRNLVIAYSLAGADCIDVAADPAVVAAAMEGMDVAEKVARQAGRDFNRPWLMVSMSAGEDPHFRKAWFDAARCPADCARPCEQVCPADAIDVGGVVRDRCYGCGRCLPICPLGLIEADSQPTTLDDIAREVLTQADALEIHTQVGQLDAVIVLWETLQPYAQHLKLVSTSCPDNEDLIGYLQKIQRLLSTAQNSTTNVMWQTDGRPMSGDIGKGTTHAAIRLAQKVLASDLGGFVQLAGGTNQYTVDKLRSLNLLQQYSNRNNDGDRTVTGVAYGSYARHLLMPVLSETLYLEEVPVDLWKAVALAESLVTSLKPLPR
ncbi:MAG: LdpA C-terminal domain-containing domain [Cyanobacteria bacterium P01_D01_bin.105]